MKRNQDREQAARKAARQITQLLGEDVQDIPLAVVLGTGWGGACEIEHSVPFQAIPGFAALGELDGHARKLCVAQVAGRRTLVLNGRVHLNEVPHSQDVANMVRLQVEMLVHLGVRRFVLTSAVGGLVREARVGNIVFVNGFDRDGGTVLPLYAGEFVQPDDILSTAWRERAREACGSLATCHEGGLFYWRGPDFEGWRYAKPRIAQTSVCTAIGMSGLPEAACLALYKDEGVQVLAIGHVTNALHDPMDHAEHQVVSAANSGMLAAVLAAAGTTDSP